MAALPHFQKKGRKTAANSRLAAGGARERKKEDDGLKQKVRPSACCRGGFLFRFSKSAEESFSEANIRLPTAYAAEVVSHPRLESVGGTRSWRFNRPAAVVLMGRHERMGNLSVASWALNSFLTSSNIFVHSSPSPALGVSGEVTSAKILSFLRF